jgi:hypothetical protein
VPIDQSATVRPRTDTGPVAMTAALASETELYAHVGRLEHALDVLRCAVYSRDWLTSRYAAATVTELGDKVETALLSIDAAARRAAGVP